MDTPLPLKNFKEVSNLFKTNPDGMRMEPTPERVFSVCQLVAHDKITRETIRKFMTLGLNDEKEQDQINKSINVALEELDIIRTKDDYLVLATSPDVISSPTAFRRYVASKVFYKTETTFFKFTKWLISQNDHIFSMRSWEGMAKTCASEVSELSTLNENAVLGWRFWAAFLGLGYLSGTMIIPNMKLRLQDILVTQFDKEFKYDEAIRATDFIAWLSSRMPEVDMTGKLPLALSAGLRTLHELDLIKLETWRDSNHVMLFSVDGDPINNFSHITVKEAVKE